MWAGVGWGPFVIWKRLVRRVLWGLVEIRAFLRASGMVRWWLLALGHWLLARSMLGTGFTRWRNSPWHNAMSRPCNCDSGLGDCLSGRVQLDRLYPSWRPAGGHAMATLYFFYERIPPTPSSRRPRSNSSAAPSRGRRGSQQAAPQARIQERIAWQLPLRPLAVRPVACAGDGRKRSARAVSRSGPFHARLRLR